MRWFFRWLKKQHVCSQVICRQNKKVMGSLRSFGFTVLLQNRAHSNLPRTKHITAPIRRLGFPPSLPLTHIPRLAIMTAGTVFAKGIELLKFRTSCAMLLGMTMSWNKKKNNFFLLQWLVFYLSYWCDFLSTNPIYFQVCNGKSNCSVSAPFSVVLQWKCKLKTSFTCHL